MTSYSNANVTYNVTPGLFTNNVQIVDNNTGNTIANTTSSNVVTGSDPDAVLADVLGMTFVSVPGSTGDISILVNLLAANTFYIGGDTTVSFAASAIASQTFYVYGGDLTFSSGLIASALSGSTINIGYGGSYASGANLASILSGSTINFTTGGGTLVLNAGGTLIDLSGSTITGYDPSKDTIELQNTITPVSTYNISGSSTSKTITLMGANNQQLATYTVSLGSGVTLANGNYSAQGGSTATNPLKITYANGNTYIGACFLPGTLIRTPDGDRPIEEMRVGDVVLVCDAQQSDVAISREVIWVGQKSVAVRPDLPDDESGYPVRVLKDAIADGVPYKDMLITAEHCLFFDGKFVPARMLVNGSSVFYDKSITSYDYYHIETQEHSIITADGVLTESYLDTGNRRVFQQSGKVVAFTPSRNLTWDDAGAPLDVSRDFVEPLFRQIEARAAQAGLESRATAPTLTDKANLHLVADTGAIIRQAREHDGRVMFMIPSGVNSVRIVSNASRPCDVIGPFVDDRRSFGVAIGEIMMFESNRTHTVKIHLTEKELDGWNAMEWDDTRWTSGNALLPLGGRLPGGIGLLSMQVKAAGPYIRASDEVDEASSRRA
ncbi:Hint domain-containing protein [Acidomonas methanolica]|uniref:Hint domain-containing protein n=1 Tax=Acidomonas methanolica TaxID=437 RepID=UPI002119E786|nr:Hint domain-containing protein [Acidomonas methanolica]MCQ9156418.1 Hint domain-containing protein [Acidomonas methanolica]